MLGLFSAWVKKHCENQKVKPSQPSWNRILQHSYLIRKNPFLEGKRIYLYLKTPKKGPLKNQSAGLAKKLNLAQKPRNKNYLQKPLQKIPKAQTSHPNPEFIIKFFQQPPTKPDGQFPEYSRCQGRDFKIQMLKPCFRKQYRFQTAHQTNCQTGIFANPFHLNQNLLEKTKPLNPVFSKKVSPRSKKELKSP